MTKKILIPFNISQSLKPLLCASKEHALQN